MNKILLILLLNTNIQAFNWKQTIEDAINLSPIGATIYELTKDTGPKHDPGFSFLTLPDNKNTSDDIVTFKDIKGLEDVLVEIKETIDFLKSPQRFIDMGAELPKGILLEGPPGTGKTLIARAIAGEANCMFLSASGSEFHKS